MKKIGMPTPDAALKEFFKDNTICASVFNGYFFNNEEVINPDELEQADTAYTESVNAEMKIDKINKYRDNVSCSGLQFPILQTGLLMSFSHYLCTIDLKPNL